MSKKLFTRNFVTRIAPNVVCGRSLSTTELSTGHYQQSLVVVGSGVAGCSTALIAAEKYNIPVTLLCAGSLPTDCNSFWAQGGIIYRNYNHDSGDGVDSLRKDVHRAGDGLCVDEAVLKLAREGPERVRELLLGSKPSFANVPFERDTMTGALKLCLEASHSAPRIIYKADHSGRAITEHIVHAAMNHPNITVHTDTIVTDLVLSEGQAPVCLGASVFNKRTRKHATVLTNKGVTLASGGLAGIYTHSTNPPGFNALGSSAALALRSKHAKLADLEYVQFHPTALKLQGEPCFLLTEALRGEGAKLSTSDGIHFATNFHPHGELAPRDIVARGVYAQTQASGADVYLDITHRDADWLIGRFPSIYNKLLNEYGLDLTKDRIPVTPAAHYTCGGIVSDEHGRTTLPNLYVAGEAARTGLHGGNRLASTSLLEALVWGASVGDFVGNGSGKHTQEWARDEIEQILQDQPSEFASSKKSRRKQLATKDVIYESTQLLTELKTTMWNAVGVVRTMTVLQEACQKLSDIRIKAEELYKTNPSCVEVIMLRDASWAGLAVARSALANPSSRGAHYVLREAVASGSESDMDEEDEQRLAAAV